MSTHSGVLVFAEQDQGKFAEVGLELVSKGRELADQLGVGLSAMLLGSGIKHLAQELVAYGCDAVYVAEAPELEYYTTLPYTKVFTDVISERKPEIVLYGATPRAETSRPE